jgi:multiple sugar transport system permease protein
MKRRAARVKVMSYALLLTTSFVMVYPVLFMALGSFSTNDQFADAIILALPNTLNIEMLIRALNGGVGQAYGFTLARCAFYISLNLSGGVIGGYIFSKLRFPGKRPVFLLLLSGMVMPAIVMIVPMFLMMARFPLAGGNDILGQGGHGFIGDWPVLFAYGWVSPLAIFLLKQSFDMLPTAYEDAAKMDGAGLFTILFRVYGPLLKAPIIALTTITFVTVWNDYLWPNLTIYGHPQWYPITMRIQTVNLRFWSATGATDYPAILMSTFLASWPPVVLYLVLQRYFVSGLVASGLQE